ncbi:MAG: hypothetical protein ACXABG_05900 [Promethearchaeota archaeon]
MPFIAGLKGLFKKPLYIFIICGFTLTWVLIVVNRYLLSILLGFSILIFGGSLLFFVLVLFVISLFKQINEIRWWIYIVIYAISVSLTLFLRESIFFPTSEYFFIIPLIVNQFFTAFFAFRLCMDSATKVDDFLYNREKSRVITRIVEFCIFGFINLWLIRIVVIFFSYTPTILLIVVVRMLQIMFWINVGLFVIVFIRLLATKKFSAYITLFFVLTLFYALYIVFDYLYGAYFSSESSEPIYVITSFIVDLLLFLYIIGTVYDRTDYIQSKLKFLKVETIALFLIIMKIYVQVSKLVPKIVEEELQILQAGGLFVIFVFFNLLFGIHSIFAHKYKIKKKKEG